MRHAVCRPANLRVHPGLAIVEGYFYPADASPTGPGQAADLVESSAGQLLPRGRKRDDRLRPSNRGTDLRVLATTIRFNSSVGAYLFPTLEMLIGLLPTLALSKSWNTSLGIPSGKSTVEKPS